MSKNFEEVNLSQRVGNYLKHRLTKEYGCTRAKFAEDFNIDDRTLRRWISGDLNKISVVDEIAYYFGVSVWDVLFGEDEDIPFYIKTKWYNNHNHFYTYFYSSLHSLVMCSRD